MSGFCGNKDIFYWLYRRSTYAWSLQILSSWKQGRKSCGSVKIAQPKVLPNSTWTTKRHIKYPYNSIAKAVQILMELCSFVLE